MIFKKIEYSDNNKMNSVKTKKTDDKIFQKNCKNIKNVLKFECKKEISRIKMKNKERE